MLIQRRTSAPQFRRTTSTGPASSARVRTGVGAASGFGTGHGDPADASAGGRSAVARALPLVAGATLILVIGLGIGLLLAGGSGALRGLFGGYDRIGEVRARATEYAQRGREVHVHGTVGQIQDVPVIEIRVFSLTDTSGTMWVRTASCRPVQTGQTVDVRATVFPGIELPFIGSTGVALMEARPTC